MICQNCGKTIDDNATYCKYCHKDINIAEPAECLNSVVNIHNKNISRISAWIIGSVILFSLILSFVIFEFYSKSEVDRESSSQNVSQTNIPIKVGDVVHFGNYYLNNDLDKEPISWKVLDINNNKVLLLTEYGIDAMPYNHAFENTTWATSSLRHWLNKEFLQIAFTKEEQELIQTTHLVNSQNSVYGTLGGANTNDKIFVLSVNEAIKYFESNDDRQVLATPYAIQKGAYLLKDNGKYAWWLRTPGHYENSATIVHFYGGIFDNGECVVYGNYVVRAALWKSL